MNIQFINENLILTDAEHLNIPLCLDCGQAFRWKETENGIWKGIAYGKFLSLKQEENKITFFNTTKEDFMAEAKAITGGKGYGYVFETAGQVPTMHNG